MCGWQEQRYLKATVWIFHRKEIIYNTHPLLFVVYHTLTADGDTSFQAWSRLCSECEWNHKRGWAYETSLKVKSKCFDTLKILLPEWTSQQRFIFRNDLEWNSANFLLF